jgi:bifunctional non-homologous end joining protein LigD
MMTPAPMRALDLSGLVAWGTGDPLGPIAGKLDPKVNAADVKYNGARVTLRLRAGGARLATEAGTRNEAAPRLAAINIPALEGTIIDGEFMAGTLPGELYPPFPRTTGALACGAAGARAYRLAYGRPTVYAFDLLAYRGELWTRRPYRERRAKLATLVKRIVKKYPDCGLVLAQQVPATPAAVTAVFADGHEGVVVKPWDSLYWPGKRRDWLKLKVTTTIDVVLTGNTRPGEGGRAGTVGAVEVAVTAPGGALWPVGYVGVPPQLAARYTDPDTGGLAPGLAGAIWEITVNGRTESGQLRHARYCAERPDKTPAQCEHVQLDALLLAA